MKLFNFDSCPYSDRNGGYGGAAGEKDGVFFENARWMIKYPKTLVGMHMQEKLGKTSLTPLSEYIGSHIYQILGYPVHETLLGKRNGMIVVACKDFCDDYSKLFEIRTIKNVYLKQLSKTEGISPRFTGDDRLVDLNTLFIQMDKNPRLLNIKGLKERFWDQVVVDGLIANTDRNNGNWGIIVGNENMIAPVFDNGASFYPKKSEESVFKIMSHPLEERNRDFLNVVEPYTLNGTDHLNWKKMLSFTKDDIPENHLQILSDSIKRNACLVKENKDAIKALFDSLPLEYEGLQVCSDIRRKCYFTSFMDRADYLISFSAGI